MKKSIKIALASLCLAGLVGSAFGIYGATTQAYTASNTSAHTLSEDSFIGKERKMIVCVSELKVYNTVSGNTLSDEKTSYDKGNEITVKPVSELIYEVRSKNNAILGYCYASGLVDTDTRLVAKVPYLWDVVSVATPVVDPDAEEGAEPEYTYEDKLLYSDLVDINEFAYRPGSNIAVSGETVLAQRELLTALSKVSVGSYDFSIGGGYGAEDSPEGCDIPVSSGALIKLTLVSGEGGELKISSISGLAESLESAGILRFGESDWFYLENYGNYLEADLDTSDYIYTIVE